MMKLTVPKKSQSGKNVKIYYVTSEAKPSETHIVVRHQGAHGSSFFCDCRDFMIRRLPTIGTSDFHGNRCKHGDFVFDTELRTPVGMELIQAERGAIKVISK